MEPPERLDPACDLALAWQPARTRPALAALFALDAHLGRIVARASEPLLAQIRLAWWREKLGQPASERPGGEPVLAGLAERWGSPGPELSGLVEGWEELLGEAPLGRDAIDRFASARGGTLGAFAERAGESARRETVAAAGRRWALADFAFRTSNHDERDQALALAREGAGSSRLPASLRGMAVLGALADRAIIRGEPLAQGRGAALLALRVGMTGR